MFRGRTADGSVLHENATGLQPFRAPVRASLSLDSFFLFPTTPLDLFALKTSLILHFAALLLRLAQPDLQQRIADLLHQGHLRHHRGKACRIDLGQEPHPALGH